ncbi:hypothetical protein GCM10027062_17920 [Nocardioides hungaricus]
MAEPEKDRPSLELPKLGLRRRKRPAPPPEPEPVVEESVDEARPIVVDAPRPEVAPEPPRPEKRERGPGGMPAAVLTGVVVGLGIVGLTWASLRSCEGVQGTASCGDAGYPLLGLILVVMVLVSWLLLRLLRVPDPGTTSFLAVGLAAVVALLVLVDRLMDRSMIVVIPLVCAATYALAHWVTRTFVERPRDWD